MATAGPAKMPAMGAATAKRLTAALAIALTLP